MPSAKTHLKIESVGLIICAIAGLYLNRRRGFDPWTVGAFLCSYVFSSLYLSPDLDLARSRASRRWGIGRVLWWPYSALFRHRRLSHHLVWGPLTRIVYLGAIVLVAICAVRAVGKGGLSLPALSWSIPSGIVCGLYLPNQIHILADRLWSLWRRQGRL